MEESPGLSTLTPIPLVLDRKDPGVGHVVIGLDHPLQVAFLQEVLGGAEILECAKLTDDAVRDRLGRPGKFIYLLSHERDLLISLDTRMAIHVWEAATIRKDSAAINVLVRYAAGILGMEEVDKPTLKRVGDIVIAQCKDTGCPQGMIWAATWALTDPSPESATWKHPWDSPWGWTNRVPVPVRLNVLYRDLAAWVFARDDDRKGAERVGVSPSKFAWLKQISMDPSKVDRALVVLSSWRSHPDDGYAAALRIGSIFDS